MDDITIPDAAVEAAIAALVARVFGGLAAPSPQALTLIREDLTAELAAAAPHIAAQALRDAADEVSGYAYTPDDVREVAHGDDYADGITDAHHVFDRLLAARIARIEAGNG